MNPAFLIRQVVNVASTVCAHINEDRVFFGMQLARRLPAPASYMVGGILGLFPAYASRATSAWLLGQETEAKNLVANARTPSRLLGEIALNLGLLTEAETIATSLPRRAASLVSRIRWTKGLLDDAIAVLPPSRRRTRLLEERLCMEVGWWPTIAEHITARNVAPAQGVAMASDGRRPAAFHILTNSLPHTRSGYAYRSHAVLTTLQEAGHRVSATTRPSYPTTIGRVSPSPMETVDGVDYLRHVPLWPKSTPGARLDDQAVWIARQALEHRADILHTTTHYVNGLATGAAAAATGIPWVYEVRGVLEETWAAAGATTAERCTRRASQRFKLMRDKEIEVASRANAVITLGATMREHLINGGVPAESITVIPNSVSEAVVNANTNRTPAEVRAGLGLPQSGIWVGTAASIVGYEGLDDLVEAVSIARQAGTDLRLLIAGDGAALPALREKANTLGEYAVFTGRVSQVAAIEYQLGLDAIVVPRKDEPVCRLVTPIKPIEAMGLSRPVIISDLPALRELVPEDAGVRVSPEAPHALADVLSELAWNDGVREGLGQKGREYVLRMRRWKDIGRRYGQVYSKLAGAGVN